MQCTAIAVKYCSANRAVCGAQVRIQHDDAVGSLWKHHSLTSALGADQTALNGARFQCCPLPPVRDSYSDLIPRIPLLGCPRGARHRKAAGFLTCNCEDHCSWEACRLTNPPHNCISSMKKDTVWAWDSIKKFWVAQGKQYTKYKTFIGFIILQW